MLELRTSDGTALWRLEVADSWVKRFKGLMGRKALPDGQGLYLPGTNGIHMLFMRFAIDCLFLGPLRPDGTRTVVGIRSGVAPWTGIVPWIRGANGVVELAAGAIAKTGLAQGSNVSLNAAD